MNSIGIKLTKHNLVNFLNLSLYSSRDIACEPSAKNSNANSLDLVSVLVPHVVLVRKTVNLATDLAPDRSGDVMQEEQMDLGSSTKENGHGFNFYFQPTNYVINIRVGLLFNK